MINYVEQHTMGAVESDLASTTGIWLKIPSDLFEVDKQVVSTMGGIHNHQWLHIFDSDHYYLLIAYTYFQYFWSKINLHLCLVGNFLMINSEFSLQESNLRAPNRPCVRGLHFRRGYYILHSKIKIAEKNN